MSLSTTARRFVSVIAVAALAIGGTAWFLTSSNAAEADNGVSSPRPNQIVMGKENAPVTVVEYASLSCPHCADFYVRVMPEFYKKYIETGKVKFIYRDFPLNEPALKAALLLHCASPEKQQPFLRVLFGSQDKWAFDPKFMESLASIASLGGMSQVKFEACMKDTNREMQIVQARKEAEDRFKVDSTPTFYIQNQKFTGPHELLALSKIIDPLLAGH